MKKTLIALATLSAIAGTASAQSTVTIYGLVDAGVVKQTKADRYGSLGFGTEAGTQYQSSQTSVAQGAKSRLGFKVVEQIDADWSAKVELEHRLKPDTGAINTTSTNQFWDMSTVAVTNKNFGEVKMGRDYMPMFYAQYLLDPWLNQGVAEIGGTSYAFAGYTNDAQRAVRYNNGLWYSVKAAGFTAIVATSRSESSTKSSRLGAAVMYSDGPLFVTAAYDRDDGANSSLYSSAYNAGIAGGAPVGTATTVGTATWLATTAITNTSNKTDTLMQIGAAYDFGFVKPRVSYVRTKQYNAAGTATNPTAFSVAATVPVGSDLVKVGFTQVTTDRALENITGLAPLGAIRKQQKFSLGYELTLSKRTAVYADFTNGRTVGIQSVNAVDAGIRHSF